MSSSKHPSDSQMQLPSWDEFDPAEEAENNDESDREHEDEQSAAKNFCPALPPSDEAGPSHCEDPQDRRQYVPPDVRHDHSNHSALYDQLPNSIGELSRNQQPSSLSIGPTLPPGFLLNGGNEDEEDPEDPGDPEDPEASNSRSTDGIRRSSLPRFSSSKERRVGEIGPALPPGFGDAFSPALPDDEIRPSSNGPSSSAMPPPEPESVRNSSWAAVTVASEDSSSKPLIGPAFPDVLPTMSQKTEDIKDDESDDEMYGPAVPPELLPGPSNHVASVEMPVEGDEQSNTDDDIIGPMPPCEQQSDDVEREYSARLAEFNARQTSANSTTTKREEWMLQLPKKLTNFGLGPRTFSTKSGGTTESDAEANRSWTETPSQKAKRQAEGSDDVAGPSGLSWDRKRNADRDATQERQADKLNKDRNVSLLEMHQKKRKVESDEKGEEAVRRPFDREKDMEVRGLRGSGDLAEVKERCGQLSSRFANSSAKKYL